MCYKDMMQSVKSKSGKIYLGDVELAADEAERLGRLLLGESMRMGDVEGGRLVLSNKASQLLRFVHTWMEMRRVWPTRQQMASELGFADKKSILPIIEELERAGWVSTRDGHRSDDWGGMYCRPMVPPFARQIMRQPNPQKGKNCLVQARLI